MDKVNVVFGRVVSGFDHIRAIEKLDTFNEKPTKKVTIESIKKFVIWEKEIIWFFSGNYLKSFG